MLDKFLHFLKEFPAQVILSIMFAIVLFTYVRYQIPFLERIMDLFAGGLLTSLLGTVRKGATVNADTVQTPTLNADTMPNATVNVNDAANLPLEK